MLRMTVSTSYVALTIHPYTHLGITRQEMNNIDNVKIGTPFGTMPLTIPLVIVTTQRVRTEAPSHLEITLDIVMMVMMG